MISKRQNSCTLNIGGEERTLKFNMNTEELYLSEKRKAIENKVDIENPYTQMKLLIYCGLQVGDMKLVIDETKQLVLKRGFNNLPQDLSLNVIGEWIGDCEDEHIEDVIKFAEISMGFILSVESATFNRQIQQIQQIAPKEYDKILKSVQV